MTNCRCDPFTGDECQACKNKMLVDKAEYERLKRLEAAAIEWNQRRELFMRDPTMETAALIGTAREALVRVAREAEKAQKQ